MRHRSCERSVHDDSSNIFVDTSLQATGQATHILPPRAPCQGDSLEPRRAPQLEHDIAVTSGVCTCCRSRSLRSECWQRHPRCNATPPCLRGKGGAKKRAKSTVQINNNYFSNITGSIIFSRGSGLRIVGREGTRALKKNADSGPEFSLARWRFGAVRLYIYIYIYIYD